MADAAATLNAIGGGSFAPCLMQGMGDRKLMIANVDVAGDYATGGVDVSQVSSYFRYLEGMICLSSGGYLFEYVPSTKKLKVMLPAAGHTHAVTLDGGATNYPVRYTRNAFLAAPTGSATKYIGARGVEAATSAASDAFVATDAGFIRKFYVDLATAPGSGKTYTATLVLNGVDTGMTVSITGTNKTGSDTTAGHAVTIAAGDRITIKSVNDDGAAAMASFAMQWEITAGAIGILTTDAASGSGGTAGTASELGAGVTLALTGVPFLAFGY